MPAKREVKAYKGFIAGDCGYVYTCHYADHARVNTHIVRVRRLVAQYATIRLTLAFTLGAHGMLNGELIPDVDIRFTHN
jgi:hypothetical protein